jgi:pentatricopeptide repeat protein
MVELHLKPNQVTFNSVIEVCVRCGNIDEAWSWLTKMRYSGVSPDNFTLSSLIKGIKPCRDYWNQNG